MDLYSSPRRREQLPTGGPILSSFRGLCQLENLLTGETLDEIHHLVSTEPSHERRVSH